MKSKFVFSAELWIYPGMAGSWYFVSLPKKDAKVIKERFGGQAKGWGSLPVEVQIRKTKWKTSIFPDNKSGTYLLPVKALVHKSEGMGKGDIVPVTIRIII